MPEWEIALEDLRHEMEEKIEDLRREIDDLRDQL
jgi:hypothetical protein